MVQTEGNMDIQGYTYNESSGDVTGGNNYRQGNKNEVVQKIYTPGEAISTQDLARDS